MHFTKAIFGVAIFVFSTATAAHAGFFDTLNRVTETANRVVETQQQLSEGKLPTAALKGGHGKHSSNGRRHK